MLIDGPQITPNDGRGPDDSYFNKKITYEEYMQELRQPIDYPDPQDPEDERYYRKYAMNMPPLECYFIIPDNKDKVARDHASRNDRKVHYGWNNITEFEQAGINRLKEFMKNQGVTEMPPGFEERDWLKWI